jgi:hypothetical protein
MKSQPTAKSETPRTQHLKTAMRLFSFDSQSKDYAIDEYENLERELNQWRDVAKELGERLREFHGLGTPNPEPPCKTYSALAKLSTLDNQHKGTR